MLQLIVSLFSDSCKPILESLRWKELGSVQTYLLYLLYMYVYIYIEFTYTYINIVVYIYVH